MRDISDDLIRRSDVVNALNSEGYTKNMRIHKKVLGIRAVYGAARSGEWIVHMDKSEWTLFGNEKNVLTAYECSACGKWQWVTSKYCPECGVLMLQKEVE